MEKKEFYKKLKSAQIGSLWDLTWDRKNGTLEGLAIFAGFQNDYPLLYFQGGECLDIDKIGGYPAIMSLKPHSINKT